MIKINLLPEVRTQKVAKQPLVSMGPGGINNYIIIGLLIIGGAIVGFRYWQLSSRLSEVRAELAVNQREYERLKPIIAEVDAFKAKNAELKHKIDVIETLKSNQYGPVRLMDEVSKALPELLWLTQFDVRGSVLSIRGQALNENAVANLITNLDASPFFAEPDLKNMSLGGQGVYSFDLSCNFSYNVQDAATAQAVAPKT